MPDLTYFHALERDLSVNFELHGRCVDATRVDEHVGEEKEHALLVTLAREFHEASLADELLQRKRFDTNHGNKHS